MKGNGNLRAASTAAATRSVARPMSKMAALPWPAASSMEPPTSPACAASSMALVMAAGSSPKPFSRSPETGSDVAAQMTRACAMASSMETLPSSRPSVPADAPLDVASAAKPSDVRMRAEPPSQQLAMTKAPLVCNARNACARSNWVFCSMLPSVREGESLARVGAHVIHDLLECGDPDFRMIAQPVDELLMRLGGNFEVVAPGTVKLQHAKALGLAHALDIGNERGAVGLVDRSVARDLERVQLREIGNHGLVSVPAGSHVFHEAGSTQGIRVVSPTYQHLAAWHGIGPRGRAVDAEQHVVHGSDLTEHPVGV